MEQLLQEIGVSQDQETEIVARALEEAGLPTTFGSDTLRLEHAIVENAVPIGNADNAQVDAALHSSSASRKRRTILLPDEWRKKRELEASTRKPTMELNSLIIEAMRRSDRNADPDVDADRPSEVTCTLCGKSFRVDAHQADNFLASHMHYCERRSSRRLRASDRLLLADTSHACVGPNSAGLGEVEGGAGESEEGEEETPDELKDDNGDCGLLSSDSDRPSSLSTRPRSLQLQRLQQSKRRSTQSAASPNQEIHANGSSPIGCQDSVASIEVNCIDDWEDDQYEERLKELSEEKSEVLRTAFGGRIHVQTWERLHKYQQQGCEWLHGLYREGTGGILADEMGLGKTAQVCAHLGSLGLLSREVRRGSCAAFLIVCPATVLQHWLNEFRRWAPNIRAGVLHGISATGRELLALTAKDLEAVLKRLRRHHHNCAGLAVITTYENLRRKKDVLSVIEWTAVCLDEGHKIRNPATAISEVCKSLPAFHRIVLSGTPIQNSLKELWSLFDFTYPGRLGSLPVFEMELATPIRIGGYANASRVQRRVAIECATTLQRIIQPYMLRRKKSHVQELLGDVFPGKVEHILFCSISEHQRQVYKEILASPEVEKVINGKIAAFRALSTLRKLCNHPALVYRDGRICWQQDNEYVKAMSFSAGGRDTGGVDEEAELETLLGMIGTGRVRWDDSGKLLVVSKILPLWKVEGHKVLIFCQTTSMLGIIEAMVREMSFQYLRLDGQTPVGKRATIIQNFNQNPDVFVMLLTTRTGGLGISLTAANRVILFDPDWNPMTDIQARERAYRLGQQRDVVIYRLLSRGTIEEKIYHRQIFKLLLSNRILENAKEKSMFSSTDLRELFSLRDEVRAEDDQLPAHGRIDVGKEEPTEVLSTEDGDAELAQDRKLLKALFDGEALASVYDHDVFESSRSSDTAAQYARNVAQRAVAAIQSSASSYVPSAPHPPSSSEASEPSGSDRFTNSRASVDLPLGSASVLQTILARGASQISSPPVSMEESIRARLMELFQSSANRGQSKLSTRAILNRFQDLGDQYAPTFRTILRDLAVLADGEWVLKETSATR